MTFLIIRPATVCLLLSSLFAGGASAEVYIFPAEDQSIELQRMDRMECYAWASEQSGFDPSIAALNRYADSPGSKIPKADPGKSRPALRSAGRGALGGVVVGALVDGVSVGEGAAYGAGIGAVSGGLRNRRQTRQADSHIAEQQAQAIAAYTAVQQNYGRAFKTCLEGKGYTISDY